MSNRGEEFKAFVSLVLDHIENYTVKQYGDAPNDNVEKWNSEKCMDAIERYVKRFGPRNGRGEEDNLLSCLKIAHYACLAYNKRKREQFEDSVFITLTEFEKELAGQHPKCLSAIADWHEAQVARADAMGFSEAAERHRLRAAKLHKEALRWEKKTEE